MTEPRADAEASPGPQRPLQDTPSAPPTASPATVGGAVPASPLRVARPVLRSRLIAFYARHNPEKLSRVDGILATFAGREREMLASLEARYGAAAVEEAKLSAQFV